MFPITMSFIVSTPAELAKLVAATSGETVLKTGTNVPKKGTADPQSERPAATQVAAAGQTASTESATESRSEGNAKTAAASAAPPADTPATPAPTAAASGADTPAHLDYDKDVKPAFLKLVQTKGRQAGRKIIDAFAPTKEKLSEAITSQEQYRQALDLIAKELA